MTRLSITTTSYFGIGGSWRYIPIKLCDLRGRKTRQQFVTKTRLFSVSFSDAKGGKSKEAKEF
jgi:hypothetical protein